MTKYSSTLLAVLAICLQLSICATVSWLIGARHDRVVFSNANTLAMLAAPAILLVCADSISPIVRVLCVIVSFEVARNCLFGPADDPALTAFLTVAITTACVWRWIGRVRLLVPNASATGAGYRQFSLHRLFAWTAAIGLAICGIQLRWSGWSALAHFKVLFSGDDWFFISTLAIAAVIAGAGTMLPLRWAIATSCTPGLAGVVDSFVTELPFNGAWAIIFAYMLFGILVQLHRDTPERMGRVGHRRASTAGTSSGWTEARR